MVLPFLDADLPAWDFSVPGVTSMSVDLHKYGFVPKGCSVVLHALPDWAGHQWFVYDQWPAGLYGSPAVAGAKSAAPVLAAWAVMQHLGLDGYRRVVAGMVETAGRIREGFESVDGVEVNGSPVGTVLSWRSDRPELSLYAAADLMEQRGWYLNRLTGTNGGAPGLHVMVSPAHEHVIDQLVPDFVDCCEDAVRAGAQSDDAGRYA
jgi:glutamate/tyrosine decarboxylase-like PLP-dependent enzyme